MRLVIGRANQHDDRPLLRVRCIRNNACPAYNEAGLDDPPRRFADRLRNLGESAHVAPGDPDYEGLIALAPDLSPDVARVAAVSDDLIARVDEALDAAASLLQREGNRLPNLRLLVLREVRAALRPDDPANAG